MKQLKVTEIFYSLQGESLFAGRPCVFIRLTGCNLRCTYCDTGYAYQGGENRSLTEIIDQVKACSCPLVEVTGGEPLFQENTPQLLQHLLDQHWTVLLETNGSYDIRAVPPACIKIVDLKCPASGEHEKNDLRNISFLAPPDQIKFVITDRADYDFARSLVPRINTIPPDHILFSPVAGRLPPSELARWILADKLAVRLHLQLHKMIWGKECRQ